MANTFLGWDIGGAHLKAVLVDESGMAFRVWQLPCPLWQGLGKLAASLDAVLQNVQQKPVQHAVTMTGELADIFTDRKAGVRSIAETIAGKLPDTLFYAGPAGFLRLDDITEHLQQIASANWFASAQFLARQVDSALFVDIGSTTSDLVPLHEGRVRNKGYSDAERMQHEELVYTGVIRTPLMSMGSHVAFAGQNCPLAAEHFATAADVYRVTGELDETIDLAPTADGAAKTWESSARRIARMICRDLEDASHEQWKSLALAFRQLQLDKLANAASRQLSQLPVTAPFIGAGAGSFLAKALSQQLGREYLEARDFVTASTPAISESAAVCFPAYAVARLALEHPT